MTDRTDRDKLWCGGIITTGIIVMTIMLSVIIIRQKREIDECLRVTKDLNHQLEWAINNKWEGGL